MVLEDNRNCPSVVKASTVPSDDNHLCRRACAASPASGMLLPSLLSMLEALMCSVGTVSTTEAVGLRVVQWVVGKTISEKVFHT